MEEGEGGPDQEDDQPMGVGSQTRPTKGGWRPMGGSDGTTARMLSGKTGSLMYMAPEVYRSEQYSHKVREGEGSRAGRGVRGAFG